MCRFDKMIFRQVEWLIRKNWKKKLKLHIVNKHDIEVILSNANSVKYLPTLVTVRY